MLLETCVFAQAACKKVLVMIRLFMAIYLFTGVAGFIESTPARVVLARGNNVAGFDNLSTGKRANISDVESEIELYEADAGSRCAAACLSRN